MTQLDQLYKQLLELGFVVLREAAQAEDSEWLEAELEMLHNVPSLIGEANYRRHEYYWSQVRPRYIDWARQPDRKDARSRMRTFYEPVWREMEPLILALTDPADQPRANAG